MVLVGTSSDSSDHTHSDAKKGKAGNTLGPAAGDLEDDGVGSEEEIQSSVDNGEVDGEEEDNLGGVLLA